MVPGYREARPTRPVPPVPPVRPGGMVNIPVVSPVVNGIAGGVVSSGVGSVMDSLTQWVAGGAASLLGWLGKEMSQTTTIDLTRPWFASHYAAVAGLAVFVAAPVAFVAVIQSIARQDSTIVIRCVLVNLPLALVAAGVAVEGVQFAVTLVDQMCKALTGAANGSMAHLLSGLAKFFVLGDASGSAGLVGFLLGSVAAFGALSLWIELALRTAAVYVATLFIPLFLVGTIMPATIPWCRRLVEVLAALIFSKLVIVAALSLGASAIGQGSGLGAAVEGCSLLLVATFAPYALLKLIPVVEAGAVHHLEGLSRRGMSSVAAPARIASTTVSGINAAMALPRAFEGLRAEASGGEMVKAASGGGSSISWDQGGGGDPQTEMWLSSGGWRNAAAPPADANHWQGTDG